MGVGDGGLGSLALVAGDGSSRWHHLAALAFLEIWSGKGCLLELSAVQVPLNHPQQAAEPMAILG